MTRVVVEDERMLATLDALSQQAEVCDKNGRVLGYYSPKPARVYWGAKSPLSPEERERILREELSTAKPLSEFWEDMKKKHPEKFQ